ncbi:GumC family protein [Vibrio algicola]|uniref:Capsular biosynthesis protein n=1 Tax=Vibrio algicola TaxID=2662262 RepID=A0A5Q0TIX1_9VIBR|nr:polysaccharide biosynthesis tyrosine autokinase [Vibrio algicola]
MNSLFVEEGSKLESTIDFSRLLKATKKNWWKILAFSILVTGISIPMILKLTPKYESFATILLKADLSESTTFDKTVPFDSTRARYFDTQYELLKSRHLAAQVVDELALYNKPEFVGSKTVKNDNLDKKKSRSIKYLMKHMTVSPVRQTQVVSVDFESENPIDAAAVVNQIVKAFVELSIDDNRQTSQEVSQFLAKQVDEMHQRLKAKEKKLNQYLTEQKLITYDDGVDGFQSKQLSLLSEDLAAATAQRASMEGMYNTVVQYQKHKLSDLAALPDVSRHPQMENLRQAIIYQQGQLSDLENRYGPKHEKVIQAQAQLRILKNQADKLINEIVVGVKDQYKAAVFKQQKLQAALNQRTNDFQFLGVQKTKYHNMTDDISHTRDLYNQLLQRQNETQINTKFIESTVKIIDAGQVPSKASKPNKMLLIVMVAIASLLIATLFILIMAALNNKVMSIFDVKRRLGLEVLGEIRAYPQAITPNDALENSIKYPNIDAASLGIRSQILLLNSEAKILAVTSAHAQEGKSLVACLVTKSMAIDTRVLLIDMDLRQSDLTLSLGDTDQLGLTDVLYQNVPVEQAIVKKQGFDWLAAGKDQALSPLVVLTHPNIVSLCEGLRKNYDYIIIDTPAISDNKDTQLISKFIDAAIFVTASNYNSSNISLAAIKQLKVQKTPFLGCVLNKVNDKLLESNENLNMTSREDIIL